MPRLLYQLLARVPCLRDGDEGARAADREAMLRTADVRGEVVSSLVRMVMPLCRPLFAPAVMVAVDARCPER